MYKSPNNKEVITVPNKMLKEQRIYNAEFLWIVPILKPNPKHNSLVDYSYLSFRAE
jgi:hypothetical protein